MNGLMILSLFPDTGEGQIDSIGTQRVTGSLLCCDERLTDCTLSPAQTRQPDDSCYHALLLLGISDDFISTDWY